MDNVDSSTTATKTHPRKYKACSVCTLIFPLDEFRNQRSVCRDCLAKQQHDYYLRTRERRSAYAKQYRAENRDTINQHQREYRAANKERLNEYARQHYAANRAERIQYRKNYYRAHIEHEQASALDRYAKGKARRYARILAPKKGGRS